MTYEAFYKACQKVARELGPDVKKMSWFVQNAHTHGRRMHDEKSTVASQALKEAA